MRSRAVRHAGRCIGLVAIVGAPALAHAQDIQTSVVASAGGSVESNPYNEANTSGAAVAATADVRPTITVRDERTTVNVSGLAQFRQFVRRYGLEDSYSAYTDIVRRQSDRLTLRGTGTFSYSEGGFNNYGRPGLSTADPVGTVPDVFLPTPDVSTLNPLTPLTDVNILGQRTRITSFASGVGADATLGAHSSVSIDLDTRAMRFELASYDDYNTYGSEVHFNHTLNELFSVGLIGDFSKTDYINLAKGDATVVDALASVDRKLGSRWSATLALGASFTTIEGRAGLPDVHFSAISTRLRFCWQGEYANFCLGGQRSPEPAASGSVRVSDTLTADYSLRLSERERVSVSGSYARTGRSRDLSIGASPSADFASASARYDNQVGRKLTAFVSGNVSKIYSQLARRRPNVGIAMGLQIRIGTGQ